MGAQCCPCRRFPDYLFGCTIVVASRKPYSASSKDAFVPEEARRRAAIGVDRPIAIYVARAFPRAYMLDRTHGESVVRKWSRRVEASLRAAKLGRDGFLIRCTFRVSRLIRWTRVAEISSTRVAAYQ
jgi:hypothetical protein